MLGLYVFFVYIIRYGVLLIVIIIAELIITLSFLALTQKINLNVRPFTDVDNAFDIGINATYVLCCNDTDGDLNTKVLFCFIYSVIS